MKLSKLIGILNEAMKYDGDMDVVGTVDGDIHSDIEINCPNEESPMYIELYHSVSDDHGKPVVTNRRYYSYRCPRCNKVVYPSEHYCSQCGQKLDWRIYDNE